MIDYKPGAIVELNPIAPEILSAWRGLENILPCVMSDFKVGTYAALEFGCEYGYSTLELGRYFDNVVAVDTFLGDDMSGHRPDFFGTTKRIVDDKGRGNITLVKQDFRDFIKEGTNDHRFNLIHIDISHDFQSTYECGVWALKHADIVIFHDTMSFPTVREACEQLANETGRSFYNFGPFNGLGIIV